MEAKVELEDAVKSIVIDEPVIEGVCSSYLLALKGTDPALLKDVLEDIDLQGVFRQQTRSATADALIYSMLAATLRDDDHFQRALDELVVFSDDFLNKMRAEIFKQGVAVAKQTVKADRAGLQAIESRAKMFLDATGGQ